MSIASSFQARLGNKTNPGFLPETERLTQIKTGHHPFTPAHALPENAPAFFGRGYILQEILSALRHPDKPRCVSLLGERRMGKSSLLNQVFAALGQEEGLVTLLGGAQGWGEYTPERFFTELHLAIMEAVDGAIAAPSSTPPSTEELPADESPAPLAMDYRTFRNSLFPRLSRYRFVLILDEFETMADNPDFDAEFFADLRHLGDTPEFRFGYLLVSRRPLSELRARHPALESSSFRDIFGLTHVLGLLQPEEARALTQGPWQRSLEVALSQKEMEKLHSQAGFHPALLQMLLEWMWRARKGKSTPGPDEIRQGLWEYFRDLWANRSQEEKAVLTRILGGKPAAEHMLSRDLRSRGLIIRQDGKDTLFSGQFEEFVRESVAEDPELSRIMREKAAESEEGSEDKNPGKKWMGGIFRLANKIGGLRGAAQSKQKG